MKTAAVRTLKWVAFAAVTLPLLLRAAESPSWLSPTALAATRDGKTLFVACATAHKVLWVDAATRRVGGAAALPASASGLALSPDEKTLFVTCPAQESEVCILKVQSQAAEPGARLTVAGHLAGGHTAMAPVVSPDGKTLFVCNRFNHNVSVFDLASGKERRRVPVQREPVAAAVTPDGRFLLVANYLPLKGLDGDSPAAAISVVDVAAGKVTQEINLLSGSGSLNDLRISPDGHYAVVSHVFARFLVPTTRVDYGWMNKNAISLINLDSMSFMNVVLLDAPGMGAANPWGVAWSGDGKRLVVVHAGTGELSYIDFPKLLDRLSVLSATTESARGTGYSMRARSSAEVFDDLEFLSGIRQRYKVSAEQGGPRAVCIGGTTAFVANYFGDSIDTLELGRADCAWEDDARAPSLEPIALGAAVKPSLVRKGEFYFHDAHICRQGWQSCASCHPGEGRSDALTWDLLNDGQGNPKNTKSLLLSFQTPPAMSLGVRDTAGMAVRSGIKYILFSKQPEEVALALDAYIQSLRPVPSPYLVRSGHKGLRPVEHAGNLLLPAAPVPVRSEAGDGIVSGWELSASAKRGQLVFQKAGCAVCHPPGLYTDLHSYDVGTRGVHDGETDIFDTPTLVELWRTAPYLHDSSAPTLREVLTTRNPHDQHGQTSSLSQAEVDDLCEFLLSL